MDLIKQALGELRQRIAEVNDSVGVLAYSSAAITEDRLERVKDAPEGYEDAKSAYHDALRNAGRTPPDGVRGWMRNFAAMIHLVRWSTADTVGLPGFQPGTSSLPGISESALCGVPSDLVEREQKLGS
jgi:hypothetical protein